MSGHAGPASYEQLLATICRRRSVRRFQDRPVPRELLEKLIEAARWAPSAGNRQPYRFLVARSSALVTKLAAAVREESGRVVEAARPDRAADLASYVRYFDWFERAPVLLAIIYRSGGPALSEKAPNRSATDALCSTAAAITHLLLAAESLGLASCWMTGPLIADAELRGLLDVPEGWSLAAFVPLGYPDETPAPPPRRALEHLVRYLDEETT